MASKLNKILYGPPGTGKTYHSISYAVAICEHNDQVDIDNYVRNCISNKIEREAVLKKFYELLASDRIRFCTFHQSLGYEDFILGIKPNLDEANSLLKYELVRGIFYKLCEDAKKELANSNSPNDNNWANNANIAANSTIVPLNLVTQNTLNYDISLSNINLDDNNSPNKQIYDKFINAVYTLSVDQALIDAYAMYIQFIRDSGVETVNQQNAGNIQVFCHQINVNGIIYQIACEPFENSILLKKRDANGNYSGTDATNNHKIIRKALVTRIKNPNFDLPSRPNTVAPGVVNNKLSNGHSSARNYITKDIYDFLKKPENHNLLDNLIRSLETNHTLQIDKDENDTQTEVHQSVEKNALSEELVTEKSYSKPTYVLIIDEINRGNVSNIFGELITLIEDSKRVRKYAIESIDDKGKEIYKAILSEEALELTIPYTDNKFSVPANVHIIGTMNTADRSVEAIDTALRRRFDFIKMFPDTTLLGPVKIANNNGTGEVTIDLGNLLKTINDRIELLIDSDHVLGHSFFINIGKHTPEKNGKDLIYTFKNNILPLLQEYFYGSTYKIGLVLGKGFYKENGEVNRQVKFAAFSDENVHDIPESKPQFELIDLDDAFDIVNAIEICCPSSIFPN
jgi:5-methylcytosine-specific restriction enzyme B